jgi:hypothetical protein
MPPTSPRPRSQSKGEVRPIAPSPPYHTAPTATPQAERAPAGATSGHMRSPTGAWWPQRARAKTAEAGPVAQRRVRPARWASASEP